MQFVKCMFLNFDLIRLIHTSYLHVQIVLVNPKCIYTVHACWVSMSMCACTMHVQISFSQACVLVLSHVSASISFTLLIWIQLGLSLCPYCLFCLFPLVHLVCMCCYCLFS